MYTMVRKWPFSFYFVLRFNMYTGELISLAVAASWTVTAVCFEFAGKKIGALALNMVRLLMAVVMLGITLKVTVGYFAPWNAGAGTWFWLLLSGMVGYVFGDFCLFNSYLLIGSRFGQLFMTLAPPVAAVSGYVFLGEKMGVFSLLGMAVCLAGISLSVIGRSGDGSSGLRLDLPVKGVMYGIGAGVGQGLGLVLSKIGMDCFVRDNPCASETELFMLPFSATQIRAFAGIAGFFVIIMAKREAGRVMASFRDRKSMAASAAGTFFGPFIGVALSLMAVRYTTAGAASTLMALTPILIIWPSRYFFKEKVTLKQVIGAVISVFGVALFFV